MRESVVPHTGRRLAEKKPKERVRKGFETVSVQGLVLGRVIPSVCLSAFQPPTIWRHSLASPEKQFFFFTLVSTFIVDDGTLIFRYIYGAFPSFFFFPSILFFHFFLSFISSFLSFPSLSCSPSVHHFNSLVILPSSHSNHQRFLLAYPAPIPCTHFFYHLCNITFTR